MRMRPRRISSFQRALSLSRCGDAVFSFREERTCARLHASARRASPSSARSESTSRWENRKTVFRNAASDSTARLWIRFFSAPSRVSFGFVSFALLAKQLGKYGAPKIFLFWGSYLEIYLNLGLNFLREAWPGSGGVGRFRKY